MLRRPCCGLAAGVLFGILIAAYGGAPLLFAALALGTAGAVIATALAKRGKWNARRRGPAIFLRAMLLSAGMLAGFARYGQEQERVAEYAPFLRDGGSVLLQGTLREKQFKNDQFVYELGSCAMRSRQGDGPARCGSVLVYFDSDEASIGETLVISGKVKTWDRAANEGNFDASAYYGARGIGFSMRDAEILERRGRISLVLEGLYMVRLGLRGIYERAMGEEEAGILSAMALGDKDLLGDESKRLYQAGGISHVMAVSGLHVSVVGMTLYGLLRRAVGGLPACVIAGLAALCYGAMTGMGTSVTRAVMMFALMLLAQPAGRSYDTLNALGAAAAAILLGSPTLYRDAGFQLSFVAVCGIVIAGGAVSFAGERLGGVKDRVYAGAAVWLSTLPLVAWHYFEIPSYAVLVNLALVPMMGALLSLGLLGGFAGFISGRLSAALLFPCRLMIRLQLAVCGLCERLPGAVVVVGRPSPFRVALYYALLAAIALSFSRERKMEDAKAWEKG